ncbi:sensor histidine kinase [Frankia sp. AgB32]|uniref:sensor histidine kinase n=1 Tax=Frankia sp. AgB32 TaxID=631119 RepID=UPI00200FADB4|nr:ATP-binding protein [Frankia sp. AgB32]MCK9895655.1 ATP-binding protein [Frankia sp. AgB32]
MGPPQDVVVRTEQRMARMVGYARAACATFVLVPLFGWDQLRHPWIAVVVVVAAAAEAGWFSWSAWHSTSRLADRLVLADVAFCVALMLVGSRAAEPGERNRIMTELVPFSLVAPAGVGFALGIGVAGVVMVAALMAAWSLAVLPDVTLKLGSDLLGFALWYAVALLIARELRALSDATAAAQEDAAAAWRLFVEQEREAESLRHREITHREIHDYLLPIVDHVAAGGTPSAALVREARRGAQRARRIIMDPRGMDPRVLTDDTSGSGPGEPPASSGSDVVPAGADRGAGPGESQASREDGETGLEAMMSAVVDMFADEGLPLVPFVAVRGEPPEAVREALVAATREALRNVMRHAGPVDEVSLFVEGDAEEVLVVVRDRGVGFDPATVRRGGGLAGSYPAISRHGGRVEVTARPGGGVKVTLRWPAPPAGVPGGAP